MQILNIAGCQKRQNAHQCWPPMVTNVINTITLELHCILGCSSWAVTEAAV